jgi:hypothetical protein
MGQTVLRLNLVLTILNMYSLDIALIQWEKYKEIEIGF